MTNVEKLALHFASFKAIPKGGSVVDGVRWFTDKDRMFRDIADGRKDAKAAIALVKTTPDNPYGDDDEAIAGDILRRVKERRKGAPGP